MDVVKRSPFEYANVPIRVHDNGGGFDADDIAGGDAMASRSGELTMSFEGEVYVFPDVTYERVRAVLLLLTGRETADSIPSSEFLLQLSDKAVDDVSSQPSLSRRSASLERFREKQKERCFEKKIRYTCRKEVAQRMHRRNGQFASLKDGCKAPDENWGSTSCTPNAKSVLHRCQHCGISESSTPAMRRGPAGPRILCNACGLMWANKGTLRDLTKGVRHIFDQNEPDTPEIKPAATASDNSYQDQDEKDLMEITEGLADDSSIGIENSSGNLGEQGTLDDLANTSQTELEIPFAEQIDVVSQISTEWPRT